MKEPTEGQTLKLWLWSGFEEREQIWIEDHYEPDGRWYAPDGSLYNGESQYGIPILDLNNLFKWAVPKLPYIFIVDFAEGGWAWYIRGCDGATEDIARSDSEDPALALFWAICKVMEEDML